MGMKDTRWKWGRGIDTVINVADSYPPPAAGISVDRYRSVPRETRTILSV